MSSGNGTDWHFLARASNLPTDARFAKSRILSKSRRLLTFRDSRTKTLRHPIRGSTACKTDAHSRANSRRGFSHSRPCGLALGNGDNRRHPSARDAPCSVTAWQFLSRAQRRVLRTRKNAFRASRKHRPATTFENSRTEKIIYPNTGPSSPIDTDCARRLLALAGIFEGARKIRSSTYHLSCEFLRNSENQKSCPQADLDFSKLQRKGEFSTSGRAPHRCRKIPPWDFGERLVANIPFGIFSARKCLPDFAASRSGKGPQSDAVMPLGSRKN